MDCVYTFAHPSRAYEMDFEDAKSRVSIINSMEHVMDEDFCPYVLLWKVFLIFEQHAKDE